MDFNKELRYTLKKIASLGSYPVHLLVIIIFFKLGMYQESRTVLYGFVIVYVIGVPLRFLMYRKRAHPENQDIFLEKYHVSSFPSFHTTRITFLSLFLSDYFHYDTDIVILSIILIILVSYARIIDKKHYQIDTVGGFLLGIFAWIIAGML